MAVFINKDILGSDLYDELNAIEHGKSTGLFDLILQPVKAITIFSSYLTLTGNKFQNIISEYSKIPDAERYHDWIEKHRDELPNKLDLHLAIHLAWLSYIGFKVGLDDIEMEMGINKLRDVVFFKEQSSKGSVAYFIAVDHNLKRIIVCFRGTTFSLSNVDDILTDINHTPKSDGDGFWHQGMLDAAILFIKEHGKTLEFLYAKYKYKLVLSGHSLGSSVASIAGFKLRPIYPDLRVITFGAPCVGSIHFQAECHNFIINIINGDDVVSRLTNTSVENILNSKVSAYDDTTLTPVGRIMQLRMINNQVFVDTDAKPSDYASLIPHFSMFSDHWLDRIITNLQALMMQNNQ